MERIKKENQRGRIVKLSSAKTICKGRHRRLGYQQARMGGAVKDAKRGAADSLTALAFCAIP